MVRAQSGYQWQSWPPQSVLRSRLVETKRNPSKSVVPETHQGGQLHLRYERTAGAGLPVAKLPKCLRIHVNISCGKSAVNRSLIECRLNQADWPPCPKPEGLRVLCISKTSNNPVSVTSTSGLWKGGRHHTNQIRPSLTPMSGRGEKEDDPERCAKNQAGVLKCGHSRPASKPKGHNGDDQHDQRRHRYLPSMLALSTS